MPADVDPLRRRGPASRGGAPVRGAPRPLAAAVAHRRGPARRRGPRLSGASITRSPTARRRCASPTPCSGTGGRGAHGPHRAQRRTPTTPAGTARLAAFVRHEVALTPGARRSTGRSAPHREVAFARAPLRELHDAAQAARRRDRQRRRADRRGGRAARLDPAPPRPPRRRAREDPGQPPPPRRRRRQPRLVLHPRAAARRARRRRAAGRRPRRDRRAQGRPRRRDARRADARPRARVAAARALLPPRSRPARARSRSTCPTCPGPPRAGRRCWARPSRRSTRSRRSASATRCGSPSCRSPAALHFGFCSDPAIVGDIDVLAQGVETEAAALLAAAALASRRVSLGAERVLSQRELNRAVLARQLLLERAARLRCRARWSESPACRRSTRRRCTSGCGRAWTGFERDQLTRALERRSVVQAHADAGDDPPRVRGTTTGRSRSASATPGASAGCARGREMSADELRSRRRGGEAAARGRAAARAELIEGMDARTFNGIGMWLDLVRVPPAGHLGAPPGRHLRHRRELARSAVGHAGRGTRAPDPALPAGLWPGRPGRHRQLGRPAATERSTTRSSAWSCAVSATRRAGCWWTCRGWRCRAPTRPPRRASCRPGTRRCSCTAAAP